jgi:hypothetical protein
MHQPVLFEAHYISCPQKHKMRTGLFFVFIKMRIKASYIQDLRELNVSAIFKMPLSQNKNNQYFLNQ